MLDPSNTKALTSCLTIPTLPLTTTPMVCSNS